MTRDLTTLRHWAVKYIGVPYCPGGRSMRGLDCWGLLWLTYLQEFHIALSELPGIASQSLFHISNTIDLHKRPGACWTEVETPFDGAAVAMSQIPRIYHHVGIWTGVDGGKIIHGWKNQGVVADSPRQIAIKSIQYLKFYRHELWPIS